MSGLNTFDQNDASLIKLRNRNIVLEVMDDLDQTSFKHVNQGEKESANRKLRRLRIILLVWLVLFVISLIWFSL